MRNLIMSGALLATLLATLFACSNTGQQDLKPAKSELELHDQYSDKLRSLMQRMSGLVHERELTAWDIDRIKKRRGEEIITVTANLVAVTDNLYQSSQAGEFGIDRQLEFSIMSQQLAIEAGNVALVTRVGDSAELAIAYKKLADVCESCHQQFRSE
jgi:cytochrome c556